VCQSAQQLSALSQQIFVLRQLTDRCLAAAAGSKAAENKYANLLLASFFSHFRRGRGPYF